MKKRWAPWKAVVVAEIVMFVLGCAIAIAVSMANGSFDRDSKTAGERFGRGFAPTMVAIGVAVYFVQRRRIENDKDK